MAMTQKEWSLQYMGPNVTGLLPGPWLPYLTSQKSLDAALMGAGYHHTGTISIFVFLQRKRKCVKCGPAKLSFLNVHHSNVDSEEDVPTITTSHSSEHECRGPCDIRSDLTHRELMTHTASSSPADPRGQGPYAQCGVGQMPMLGFSSGLSVWSLDRTPFQ